MIAYFLLGVAFLVGALMLLRVIANADTRALMRAARWALAGLAGIIVLYLAVTGRIFAIIPALLGFIPLILRWIPTIIQLVGLGPFIRLLGRFRGAQGGPFAGGPFAGGPFAGGPFAGGGPGGAEAGSGRARTGQRSEIDTATVRMILDHDSGAMTGTVRRGTYQGRRVEDLRVDQLITLLREAQADDSDGARLIEAYLDRQHPDWRDQAEAAGRGQQRDREPAGEGPRMSRDYALSLLGLQEGASEAEIQAAYRRLMAKVHPDTGGSDTLAAQINAARDTLLDT